MIVQLHFNPTQRLDLMHRPVLHEPEGDDLHTTVDEKPDQGVSPDQQGISPADGIDEPAVDCSQCADHLGCFGGNEKFPARKGSLPDGTGISGQVDGQVTGHQELKKNQV